MPAEDDLEFGFSWEIVAEDEYGVECEATFTEPGRVTVERFYVARPAPEEQEN